MAETEGFEPKEPEPSPLLFTQKPLNHADVRTSLTTFNLFRLGPVLFTCGHLVGTGPERSVVRNRMRKSSYGSPKLMSHLSRRISPSGQSSRWRPKDLVDGLNPEATSGLGRTGSSRRRRSGSSTKNTLAALSISLAFISSAFSRRRRAISAAASVVTPNITAATAS